MDDSSFTDALIKGSIAQVIARRMFTELGFLVTPLGQETIITPYYDLARFVGSCDGKLPFRGTQNLPFSVEVDNEQGSLVLKGPAPDQFVRNLPDFILTHKSGRQILLEVKYRASGILHDELQTLALYPMHMLVIAPSVDADRLKRYMHMTPESAEQLVAAAKESPFMIWVNESSDRQVTAREERQLKAQITSVNQLCTLRDWLKTEFDIDDADTLQRHGRLVRKWYAADLKK